MSIKSLILFINTKLPNKTTINIKSIVPLTKKEENKKILIVIYNNIFAESKESVIKIGLRIWDKVWKFLKSRYVDFNNLSKDDNIEVISLITFVEAKRKNHRLIKQTNDIFLLLDSNINNAQEVGDNEFSIFQENEFF